MVNIRQLTPAKLLENQHDLENYLEQELSGLVSQKSWMTDWKELASRFQLFNFKELTKMEIRSFEWNAEQIEKMIYETVQKVSQYLPFKTIHITVVPAVELPFFKSQPQAMWTNAFTNGPGTIIIAIPPQPDKDFLQYLIAHECHHACPENPIYTLSLSTFTLEEWYKMEGTAEYFALTLYPDKRWWKDTLPPDKEAEYWEACKYHLKTTDDHIKMALCFGSRKKEIPVFAGYSFALKAVSHFASVNQIEDIRNLFWVEPSVLMETYAKTKQGS
ncbi:DUF2268 domain-containing putative Zn-dependent protease [Jeotgalibacillus proteolyticus]|uniref:DUF2268 domain-containing protein n=1 Tax=Jeotgalibacillus proteolyticus TaxID=2082395 RepID=A0A2S5G8P2_9BACL|nr:DUF2268 domain-containing putative Zn-dependent protease [Jeotgalibacillus proteolyticus]PPA69284.1 hypothetical protein C4B60_15900 [Jeotgalibacillus proteolyticus]